MTAEPCFIHLRHHTEYSLLEGALRLSKSEKIIKDDGTSAEEKTHPLIDRCVAENMPALGMTDTQNMFGAMAFSQYCMSAGIKPILGCQINISLPKSKNMAFMNNKEPEKSYPVVLFAQNHQGYLNLVKICSEAHLKTEPPATPNIPLSFLTENNKGLILLTGGAEGLIGSLIQSDKKDEAKSILIELAKAYGNRLYIELQRHGLKSEDLTEPTFLEFAYELNLPLVATNESFFMDEDMFEAHDALLCIANKTYVNTLKRRRLNPEYRFKSAKEMVELFKDLPEAITNTVEIAKRCSFALKGLPAALPHFAIEEGKTEADVLREMATTGLQKRLEKHVFTPDMTDEEKEKIAKPYRDRLEYELNIIIQMEFPGYFLIVSDFIQWSKAHNIPVGPGRGSGAGSVVAWALTITDLNPLRFNLLFERFLNPERVSMPDFDIDFCQEKREKTIEYVQNKYGFDHVAQIITFGKLQARAVLRDVGRVLEIPYPVVDRICKLVPNDPGSNVTLKEVMATKEDFKAEIAKDERYQKLIEISLKLEGLLRNASTHAAGVVIGAKPLEQIVPLYRDPDSDMPVTQFDKHWVESASLIKFDFLGLKTLTTIAKCLELIKKNGKEIDISSIPLNDKKTYELLQNADTYGVFQLESRGMRDILHKLKPDKLEDLIAIVALFRPGPMENIPSYIARKHGAEQPDYLHPMLEGILKETYGIMIYQEQVMQIAQVMAGYTLGGADLLRKAMGKKNKEEMKKQRAIFVKGAKERGVDEDKAKDIFAQMEKFAGYGFNKSHAACYAFIAYQTAYLKANFPLEFLAASMTMDSQDTTKLEGFKHEIITHGFGLLPPDINKAMPEFSVEKKNVRFALSAIKGVGIDAMQSVVDERNKNGKFKSFTDFLTRINKQIVGKRCLEALTSIGAFDSLYPHRATLYESAEIAGQYMDRIKEERDSNQTNLFAAMPEEKEIKLTKVPDWTMTKKLEMEKDAIGFFLSAHPLDEYARTLKRLGIRTFTDNKNALARSSASSMTLAGIVGEIKKRTSKSGRPFAFISASDSGGIFEMLTFSEILETNLEKLESKKPLVFYVSVDQSGGEDNIRLSLQSVSYLDEIAGSSAEGISVTFTSKSSIAKIKEIIASAKKGRGKIILIPRTDSLDIPIELPGTYDTSSALLNKLRDISGVIEATEL